MLIPFFDKCIGLYGFYRLKIGKVRKEAHIHTVEPVYGFCGLKLGLRRGKKTLPNNSALEN